METTKPRLVLLVLWSVTVGFLLASQGATNWPILVKTLLGAGLAAAGSMALNQWMEWERDAQMKRTADRPLPQGKLRTQEVFFFGIILSVTGVLVLAISVNLLSSALAAFTLLSYLFFYTPLKTRTWLCTWAGALPGALPPLIGWAACKGHLGGGAIVLFSILFVWQLPHFLAIAWMYREDYARAGFQMLSVVDPSGERLKKQMVIHSFLLLLLSLVPPVAGMTGLTYYGGAFLLGIWFLVSSFKTAFQLNLRSRTFFRNSILYLSGLLFLMVLDKQPF